MSAFARAKNIGIYNLHMPTRGGGEKLTLVLAEHLGHAHHVQLFHHASVEPKELEDAFAVDLRNVEFSKLDDIPLPLRVVAKLRGGRHPYSTHHYRQLKKLNLDLFINISHGSMLPNPANKGIFLCMFPHDPRPSEVGLRRTRNLLAGSIEKVLTASDMKRWLESYSRVIAISQYSADWVQQLWRRQVEVIYPPADDMGPPAPKEKIILHVGRFTPSNSQTDHHHKAQEFLLSIFLEMKDLHAEGWELHFAGNVGSDEKARQLAAMFLKRGTGLPVKFHFNARFEALRDLYRRAAIYWHATGVGTDAQRYPQRHEHFGITTVEAMSAGAVPVVINSGGQKEIVSDGINGLCWSEVESLLRQTRTLANDPALRDRLSRAAIESSKKFRREVFVARMDESITRVLGEPADPTR